MKTLNLLTSTCRFCRYYQPEGRRGGVCQILGVPVQGSWKACGLAIPTFAPSWENREGVVLSDEMSMLPASRPLVAALDVTQLDSSEQAISSTPERKKAEPVLV